MDPDDEKDGTDRTEPHREDGWRPKRGAFPTPKSEIEKAKKYDPAGEPSNGEPADETAHRDDPKPDGTKD